MQSAEHGLGDHLPDRLHSARLGRVAIQRLMRARLVVVGDVLVEHAPHVPLYSPHSLRATTATLLLDSGVDIVKVQGLLGHRHVTTTQIYDKRRRSTAESASHEVPI